MRGVGTFVEDMRVFKQLRSYGADAGVETIALHCTEPLFFKGCMYCNNNVYPTPRQ
jgi:hypothetical protein